MPKQAIIIAVNPMPRLYLTSLIEELRPTHDVQVLTFYRTKLLNTDAVESARSLGANVRQFSFKNYVDQFFQLHKAGHALRGWIKKGDQVDIFICQPDHFLTNYPTFYVAPRDPDRVSIHLIPDGTANFYETSIDPYVSAMKKKRLVGVLLGLPFSPYRDTYLALRTGNYADYWYMTDPGLMGKFMPVRRFPAPPPPANQQRTDSDWLFLGQPPLTRDHRSVYLPVLRQLVSRSKGTVHYKAHPAETLAADWRKDLEDIGLHVLESTDTSAEELSMRYAHVACISSSAAFNLRMLGWHESLHSVQDVDLLRSLTGRSEAEIDQVVALSKRIGLIPL